MADFPNYNRRGQEGYLQILNQVFKYVGAPYITATPLNYVPLSSLFGNKQTPGVTVQAPEYNFLGRPILMPLKFDGYSFTEEPLVRLEASHKIIKSEIDGQNGTVKEHWRFNDYMITLEGLLIDYENTDTYCSDLVRAFRSFFEQRISHRITEHEILKNVFGIEYIAIEKVEILDSLGAPNYQPFRITALSDKLYDLNLEDLLL